MTSRTTMGFGHKDAAAPQGVFAPGGQDIYGRILELAAAVLPSDGTAIWLFEAARHCWRIVSSRGLSPSFVAVEVAGGEDQMGVSPVIINDVSHDDQVAERYATLAAENIRSMLVVPLYLKDKRSGTIAFYFKTPHEVTPEESSCATSLAALASSALSSGQLYAEQTRAREQSDFLAQASAVLGSSLDFESTLASVAQLAVPHIADWCAVDVVDETGGLKRVAVAHIDPAKVSLARKLNEQYPPEIRPDRGVGWSLRTGKSQLIPVVSEQMVTEGARDAEHLCVLRDLGIRSVMITPLVLRDSILGVITFVGAESGRTFEESDLTLAETVADRAAVAIDHARLFRAVQESEAKFRAVSETASCAIYIHDGQRVLYVNYAAEQLSGYSRDEIAAGDMWSFVHPDDREMVQQRAQARMRGEPVPNRYEYRIVRKDGATVWLDFTAAIVDYAGRRVLLATAFDITSRKIAQHELQARELEARTLLQNMPDVVSRFDSDLRYRYVSPNVVGVTGIQSGEFVGKSFRELGFTNELSEKWEKSIRSVFETGESNAIEFSFPGLAGEMRHYRGTAVAERVDGGAIGSVLTLTRDVTEERNAQLAMKRSESDLRMIIDTVPALVAYVDRNERFLRVNRTFTTWFQRPLSDCIGHTVKEVLGPSNYSHVRDKMQEALKGHAVQFEATNQYADRTRHVLITYTPDVDQNGNVSGFVSMVADVTDRKLAEEALRRSEKLATAGRLAATIAHEINNPLEAITNLLFLIRNDEPGSTTFTQYVDMADHELRRVSHIARQTLGFYRDSTGASRFDLQTIVDDVLLIVGKRVRGRNVEFLTRYKSAGTLVASQGEVRQVIANLLTNAVDATDSGKIVVSVRRSTDPRTGTARVTITVADTGHGIPPTYRARLFEPFFTTKKDIGTGLGLWVTKQLVEKNGGRIQLRSRVGENSGTVFRVILPEIPTSVG